MTTRSSSAPEGDEGERVGEGECGAAGVLPRLRVRARSNTPPAADRTPPATDLTFRTPPATFRPAPLTRRAARLPTPSSESSSESSESNATKSPSSPGTAVSGNHRVAHSPGRKIFEKSTKQMPRRSLSIVTACPVTRSSRSLMTRLPSNFALGTGGRSFLRLFASLIAFFSALTLFFSAFAFFFASFSSCSSVFTRGGTGGSSAARRWMSSVRAFFSFPATPSFTGRVGSGGRPCFSRSFAALRLSRAERLRSTFR